MGVGVRSVKAVLMTAFNYVLYIYLPGFLLNYVSGTEGFNLDIAEIEIGSFDDLVYYIQFFGFIICGMTFAQQMAAKDTPVKAIWRIFRAFLSIIFWTIFIVVDFNTIDVIAALDTSIGLDLTINITGLFWVMMGATIFEFILGILDLLVGIFAKEEKKDEGGL